MEQPTQIAAAAASGDAQEPPQEQQPEAAVEVAKHRRQPRLRPGAEEKLVLQFMDSVHGYLSLSHALSSALRQGWMELASARHSMGAARINSSLLDLKLHPAATTLKITEYDVDSINTKPYFVLRKWVSSEHETEQPQDSISIKSPGDHCKELSKLADDNEVQKERSKSLSVFGVLISPKLRAAQLSFERALETLVEIANVQSSLRHSFHQLHQEVEDTTALDGEQAIS